MFLESFQFPVCHDPHLSYVCHLSERLSEVRTALSRSQCFSWMMAGPRVWSVILLSSVLCLCRAYEVVNSTEIKAETNSGLKNYEEEEDGKVLPYRYSGHVETHKLTCDFRTFLTTVEIVVICVVTVVLVILLSLLTIYVCMYGWVLPKCCR